MITQNFLLEQTTEESIKKSMEPLLLISGGDRACWFEIFTVNAPGAFCMQSAEAQTLPEECRDGFISQFGFSEGLQRWEVEMRAGKVVIEQVDKSEDYINQFLRSQGVKTFLTIPIFIENELAAFLRVDHCNAQYNWEQSQIDEIKKLCESIQDNLQRLRTQKNLRLLSSAVKNVSDGIVITDERMGVHGSKIVFANTAASTITGYTEAEMIGKGSQMMYVSQESMSYAYKSIRDKQPFHGEILGRKKNGREYLADLNISPITSARGEVTHTISVMRDITQKKEVESRASLSSKLESIGQLAAGIAHEINTPAQFISDNLYFIKENWSKLAQTFAPLMSKNEELQKAKLDFVIKEMPGAISDAIEGVERISTIVQAMREFSHSSGEKNRANINSAIETTLVVARNEWKYCAEVKTQLDPELPQIPCFISDINQVVLNLIVNSAQAIKEKFGPDKKGLIVLRTLRTPTHIKIEVEDNGKGIPESIRQKIFDPFFTTKPINQGTGQGLYLSHRLITQKNNGTIEFTSTVGEGTKFTITLPLSQAL
jgi:PAS domain S-box-containing protein